MTFEEALEQLTKLFPEMGIAMHTRKNGEVAIYLDGDLIAPELQNIARILDQIETEGL